MRHNQVIYLLTATVTQDEIGNEIETLTERKVYANKMSVSATEFHNAALSGLRIAKQFEIYTFEYAGEERLKHEGVIYRIIRPDGRGEKTRLTCERVAADG